MASSPLVYVEGSWACLLAGYSLSRTWDPGALQSGCRVVMGHGRYGYGYLRRGGGGGMSVSGERNCHLNFLFE